MLLSVSENLGYAGGISLFRLHFFSVCFRLKVGTPSKGMHMSCLRLMLRLLTFVLCCSLFQKTLAMLVSFLCLGFIFFFCLFSIEGGYSI